MSNISIAVILLVGFILLFNASKRTLVLGTNLLNDKLMDEELSEINNHFKKQIKLCRIYFSIFSLPEILISFIFKGYPSLNIIYFFLWVGSTILVLNKIYTNLRKKTMKIGTKQIIRESEMSHKIDIQDLVHIFSNDKILPIYWFALPICISVFSLVIIIVRSKEILIISIIIIEILFKCIAIIMYKLTTKLNEKEYDKTLNINTAISSEKRRMWSVFWVLLSTVESIIFIILVFSVLKIIYINYIVKCEIIIISISVILIYVLVKYKNIQMKANLINKLINENINFDDEQYNYILNYERLNNEKIIVENGIGYTFNLDNVKGKFFVYTIILFIIAMVIFLIISDFYIPNIYMSKNEVMISDLDNSYSVKTSEIKEVKLVNSIDISNKIYGTETVKYARGKFNLDNYGESQVYIFKDVKKYIIIRLSNVNIIYNENSINNTIKDYKKICNLISSKDLKN